MLEWITNAIEAHGVRRRWSEVQAVSATFLPGGLALRLRGQEAFSKRATRVTVETGEQRVRVEPFIVPNHVGLYEPRRTAVVTTAGAMVEELENPRESFERRPRDLAGGEGPLPGVIRDALLGADPLLR